MNSRYENKSLLETIKRYNCGSSDIVAIQKELWALWRFNHKVYVPIFEDYAPPYDLGIVPTDSGQVAYVIFTEWELITEDIQVIKEMPFQELLDRIYNSHGMVNGVFINPSINGTMSEYSIGLTEEFLKKVCRGSILI